MPASKAADLAKSSWFQGRAADNQADQRFQSLGVEFEVKLAELLPLCIPPEGKSTPTSQRTAACLSLLNAFGELCGPPESELREQFSLVVDQLRWSIYSHNPTSGDRLGGSESRATMNNHGGPGNSLQQIPFHELCHDLMHDKLTNENEIEDLNSEIKSKESEIEHLLIQLKIEQGSVSQLDFKRGQDGNKKAHLGRQIEAQQREIQSLEKEAGKCEEDLLYKEEKYIAEKDKVAIYKEECEKLKDANTALNEKYISVKNALLKAQQGNF
jgi:hypothetical protein